MAAIWQIAAWMWRDGSTLFSLAFEILPSSSSLQKKGSAVRGRPRPITGITWTQYTSRETGDVLKWTIPARTMASPVGDSLLHGSLGAETSSDGKDSVLELWTDAFGKLDETSGRK